MSELAILVFVSYYLLLYTIYIVCKCYAFVRKS
jgi:hypothetical protein